MASLDTKQAIQFSQTFIYLFDYFQQCEIQTSHLEDQDGAKSVKRYHTTQFNSSNMHQLPLVNTQLLFLFPEQR